MAEYSIREIDEVIYIAALDGEVLLDVHHTPEVSLEPFIVPGLRLGKGNQYTFASIDKQARVEYFLEQPIDFSLGEKLEPAEKRDESRKLKADRYHLESHESNVDNIIDIYHIPKGFEGLSDIHIENLARSRSEMDLEGLRASLWRHLKASLSRLLRPRSELPYNHNQLWNAYSIVSWGGPEDRYVQVNGETELLPGATEYNYYERLEEVYDIAPHNSIYLDRNLGNWEYFDNPNYSQIQLQGILGGRRRDENAPWTFSEDEIDGKDRYFLGGFLADNSPFVYHYNSIIEDKSTLEGEKSQLKAEVEGLRREIEIGLVAAKRVFPYVNWNRANRSKAWYKDVDWSVIPFNDLSDGEQEKLDWSKINYIEANNNDSFDPALIDWSDIRGAKKAHQIKAYKAIDWGSIDYTALDDQDKRNIDWTKVNYGEAQSSEDFDIFSLDWGFLNQLGAQPKKRVYQKVAWNDVDFTAGDSSGFDWSAINLKKAMVSDAFALNAVDIDETKQTKNFKRLSAALKKSSADDLLAGASDDTLQAIGYENFVGKIADSLVKNFTTTSREYSMILKPLSYTRAAAVATAMGGSLASQATGDSYDDELVDEI